MAVIFIKSLSHFPNRFPIVNRLDSATTTATDLLTLNHTTTGTPAAGFGTSILFNGQDASKTAGGDNLGRILFDLATATAGAEITGCKIQIRTGGGALTTSLSIRSTGTTITPLTDSTTSFLVEKADGTDFFSVDTTNSRLLLNGVRFSEATSGASIIWNQGYTTVESRNTGAFVVGSPTATATDSTTRFLYIPSCAGTPTGTPSSFTGKVP